MEAEHCTDTAADPRPRVCQLAVCTSCGRVTKRWAEISLRLHLVLDSEKEVDLPTEPSSQWMSDRQFNRRTRAHKVVLLESPSQPSDVPEAWCTQIRVRPLAFYFHYLRTWSPNLPEFFGLWLSFWKWELTRDQSSRPSQRSVSPSCSHPSNSPFILRSLYLLFLPLSSKVTKKSTPPCQAHVHGDRKCTDLMYSGKLVLTYCC